MRATRYLTALLCLPLGALAGGMMSTAHAADSQIRVYFGTYTGGNTGSKGIYTALMNTATGRLSAPELAAEVQSPSFLAIHPNRHSLYAANEVSDFQGKKAGAVTAFRIDLTSGKLTLLNEQSSGGTAPCHVAVDPTGRCLLAANYGGGSVLALPIGADGRLGKTGSFVQHVGAGPDKQRQEAPHAHSINANLKGNLAYAADLGLDKVLIYKLDAAQARLTPSDPPFGVTAPGAGPRHLAWHPSGRFAYVCGEMTSTLTAFAVDAKTGGLTQVNSLSTIPAPTPGNSTAEVRAHPNGRFVYVSNRGHNSIAIFRIDGKTGAITTAGHQATGGSTPRNFELSPDGKFLLAANQASGNVVVFKVDGDTGQLAPADSRIDVPACVCVKFVH